ncbi:MAG: aldose 1-epimerase family protein [Actinomycetota bacterium]
MDVFGKSYSKKELVRKIGDISQLGGVKEYQFTDGLRKGVRAIDLKSPSGLDMTVLADRGLDISYLSYKSAPIGWRSAVPETSPAYYDSSGLEWLRTFYGGLLTTCGLTYMGAPSVDRGQELGIHGRISNLAAANVCADGRWDGDDYQMFVQGKVREASVFGPKLELSRKITTWMGKPKVFLEDEIENIGSQASPLMVLYHINIGFPVLDSTSELLEAEAKVWPRDEEAKKGRDSFNRFIEPVTGYNEQCFFHDIEADSDGYANVAIVNPAFDNDRGIGIAVRFKKESLPNLIQWKMMGADEYVCGIEPANSWPRGRAVERKEGNLQFIEPGETVRYRIEFEILPSNKYIEIYRKKYCE